MSTPPPAVAPVSTGVDKPLRVAVVITELDPGGAERALVEIVTRWPDNWQTHVYCLGPEAELADRLRQSGIGVTCLGAKPRHLPQVIWRLRRLLRSQQPEVIQTWLFHGNLVGRLAAVGLPCPVVATHRVAERESEWHLKLERLTGRLVDAHIAVSQSVADFLRRGRVIPASAPLFVVPNGVDPDRVLPRSPSGTGRVIAAGRLHRQKGFDVLLDAWAVVQNNVDKTAPTLTIFGEGPDRDRLSREAESLNVEGVGPITLPGRSEDLFAELAAADLFVLSSRWEGMPNVLLEAVAAGCPVVSTDVEGVREILGADQDPVPAGDADALAARILGVLSDPESAEASASRLQTQVLERLMWSRTASEASRVLRAVVDSAAQKNLDRR